MPHMVMPRRLAEEPSARCSTTSTGALETSSRGTESPPSPAQQSNRFVHVLDPDSQIHLRLGPDVQRTVTLDLVLVGNGWTIAFERWQTQRARVRSLVQRRCS